VLLRVGAMTAEQVEEELARRRAARNP
jgi:hypothetical protein